MQYRITTLLCISFMTICIAAYPQESVRAITARKINRDLTVDGQLSEPEWLNASQASDFRLNFPADTALASGKTIVKVLYNDRYLYISAILNSSVAGQHAYNVSSLKRDFPFFENDAFGIIIDPFNDHANGYGFYVNAYGVQREEQIYNGLSADATWDIKWTTEVRRNDSGWTAELAIPLRYLRFNQQLQTWNINFLRNDIGNNERSSWAATPRNFTFPNLSYAGQLLLPEPLHLTGTRISVIPSLTFNGSQIENQKIDAKVKPSVDAKIALTSSLNLDLTVNPDFSQAEVDDAQVNLTRFELSYPEKRVFFVENSDLFSEFGIIKEGATTLRPFYSRRIGLKYNNTTGQFEQTSVIAGARVSGKLTKDLRVGLMSVQTAAQSNDDGISKKYFPSQNYSVLALQKKIFSSSNIGIIFTNRQAFGTDSSARFQLAGNDFNRLVGAEYNLISRNGQWTGKVFEHIMLSPHTTSSSQGGWLNYNAKKIYGWAGITKAGKDFNPDIGFIPRNNFVNGYGETGYLFYPTSKIFNYIKPLVHYNFYLDEHQHQTDHNYRLGGEITFKNTADCFILYVGNYTKLVQPFDPSQKNKIFLDSGTGYKYNSLAFYYLSDLRKKFAYEFYYEGGEFFNGHFTQFIGYFTHKIQPWGSFGVRYNVSLIRLPAPYSKNDIIAIGPKADISLSKKLFLNANVQYTNLNNNINYFFRLQYRFLPLSDIYLVYGNNQNTRLGKTADQSLILKFTYFF